MMAINTQKIATKNMPAKRHVNPIKENCVESSIVAPTADTNSQNKITDAQILCLMHQRQIANGGFLIGLTRSNDGGLIVASRGIFGGELDGIFSRAFGIKRIVSSPQCGQGIVCPVSVLPAAPVTSI